ncbi:MAG: zf-TFIIB domain-containing protein [archaeon]
MKLNQFEPLGCPRCSGLFKAVMRKMRHPSGAILDVCDKCGGMWLDGPEVKQLYRFSVREEIKSATLLVPAKKKKRR